MKKALFFVLTLLCGCTTSGEFLTPEKNGWFNVQTKKSAGLYYCHADEAAAPKCHKAAVIDEVK